MTLLELYSELKQIGIADSETYLHGLHGSTDDNEKLSITIKEGRFSAIWEVYYKERGEKHSIREFYNETDACEYYFNKMKESHKYGA